MQGRLIQYAFAGMLLLFGAAAVLAVVLPSQLGTVAPAGYPLRFGFGWVWLIFGFFFVFWLFRLAFWPWRPYRHHRHWAWGGDEALSILRQRYASGELTREQYEQMKQDLRREQTTTTPFSN